MSHLRRSLHLKLPFVHGVSFYPSGWLLSMIRQAPVANIRMKLPPVHVKPASRKASSYLFFNKNPLDSIATTVLLLLA